MNEDPYRQKPNPNLKPVSQIPDAAINVPELPKESIYPVPVTVQRPEMVSSLNPTDDTPSTSSVLINESSSKQPFFQSLLFKLILLAILLIYATIVVTIPIYVPRSLITLIVFVTFLLPNTSTVYVTIALLALPLIFVIRKNMYGFILPYLGAASILYTTQHLITITDNIQGSKSLLRPFIPIVSLIGYDNLRLWGISLAIIVAFGSLLLLHHQIKYLSEIIKFSLRTTTIFLFLFSTTLLASLIIEADNLSGADIAAKQQITNSKLKLDANIPIYDPVMPEYFSHNSGARPTLGGEGKSYEMPYWSFDHYGSSGITLGVKRANLPSTCLATTQGQVKKAVGGNLYSCNIVLITAKGEEVYGLRDNFKIATDADIDPLTLTATELRAVQPREFYIKKGDVLVTIRLEQRSIDDPIMTPVSMEKLVNSLQPLTGVKREQIITKYLQGRVSAPLYTPHSFDYSMLYWSISTAIGLALMTLILEKLFTKAEQGYWKVYLPMYGTWTLFKIAGQPGWWSLIIMTPLIIAILLTEYEYAFTWTVLIPLFYPSCVLAIGLILWSLVTLTRKFNKPFIFSLLLLPPFIGWLILAFGKASYGLQNSNDNQTNKVDRG